MYNKNKFNKIDNKKILHKINKQWVIISIALFMIIGSGVVLSHTSASASSVNQNTVEMESPRSRNSHLKNISNKATQLHNKLMNQASVKSLRLGSNYHSGKVNYSHILKNRFRRSNNKHSLKKSGFVNTSKFNGKFIFNKYAPNDKRAIVSKRLSLRYLNWAKGHLGDINPTLFIHKRNGWLKLNHRKARKYKNTLIAIYKKANHNHKNKHVAKFHLNYVSKNKYNKYNKQLKSYRYSMYHGSKHVRKYNKRAYYNLKNRMKHILVKGVSRKYHKVRRGHKKSARKTVNSKSSQSKKNVTPVNFNSDQSNDQSNNKFRSSESDEYNNQSDQSNNNSDTSQFNQSDQPLNSDQSESDNNISPSDQSSNSDQNNSDNQDVSDNSDNLSPSQQSEYIQQMKAQTLNDINQDRQANGQSPVTENSTLDKLAAIRVQQSVQNFSHYNAQGQFYGTLDAPQVGLPQGFDCAENLAQAFGNNGIDAANQANDEMMNHDQDSGDGHRMNILDSDNTLIGIGTAYNNGTYYVAEDFGNMSSDSSESLQNDGNSQNSIDLVSADVAHIMSDGTNIPQSDISSLNTDKSDINNYNLITPSSVSEWGGFNSNKITQQQIDDILNKY